MVLDDKFFSFSEFEANAFMSSVKKPRRKVAESAYKSFVKKASEKKSPIYKQVDFDGEVMTDNASPNKEMARSLLGDKIHKQVCRTSDEELTTGVTSKAVSVG